MAPTAVLPRPVPAARVRRLRVRSESTVPVQQVAVRQVEAPAVLTRAS